MIEKEKERFELAKIFMDEEKYGKAIIELNSMEGSLKEKNKDIPQEIYRLKMEINQKKINLETKYLKEAFKNKDYKKAKNILKTSLFISINCYRFASEELGKEEEPLLPIEYYEIEEKLRAENL